ncbi:MAG: DUF819 family protein [Verrucomicrobiota bacterium]
MSSFLPPNDPWPLWGVMIASVGLCVWLEQARSWGGKIGGPLLALVAGMALSNLKIMPVDCASYDVVDSYLVPLAIPLLLFRANVVKIVRETGQMFLGFHVAAVGTMLGGFLAAFLFNGSFARVPEVTGIMSASYIGGGVNFVAVSKSYDVSPELTNPLLVADNFIMAGMFAVLFMFAEAKFFRRRYAHPHSVDVAAGASESLAAKHWKRKEIALLDIAKAFAVAFVIAAVSIKATGWIKASTDSKIIHSIFGNAFILITVLTVALTTLWHREMENIHGSDELGMYLLYVFFLVIGLRADLVQVILNVPVLFGFCLVMAATNLVFTLVVGKLFKLNLEELLLSVNATLGGAPSAAAMAIAKGWSNLVLPGLLAGIWGYVIGTFLGVVMTEALKAAGGF